MPAEDWRKLQPETGPANASSTFTTKLPPAPNVTAPLLVTAPAPWLPGESVPSIISDGEVIMTLPETISLDATVTAFGVEIWDTAVNNAGILEPFAPIFSVET